MTNIHKRTGFTLIELSIVLVIIGLIIGGVLVGRDLIRAAEIRATASQIEKHNAAALAFRLKYGQLPGDIQPAIAGGFGLFQVTGTCTTCRFNNGLIDQSTGGDSPYEYFVFWRHLSDANLIEGSYGRDATNPLNATTGRETDNSGNYFKLFTPTIKAQPQSYWAAEPGYRYGVNASAYNTGRNDFLSVNLVSPSFTQALDSKIDDGMPNTGSMVDMGGTEMGNYDTNPSGVACTYGATDDNPYETDAKYNVGANNGANSLLCRPRIKTAF